MIYKNEQLIDKHNLGMCRSQNFAEAEASALAKICCCCHFVRVLAPS